MQSTDKDLPVQLNLWSLVSVLYTQVQLIWDVPCALLGTLQMWKSPLPTLQKRH